MSDAAWWRGRGISSEEWTNAAISDAARSARVLDVPRSDQLLDDDRRIASTFDDPEDQ